MNSMLPVGQIEIKAQGVTGEQGLTGAMGVQGVTRVVGAQGITGSNNNGFVYGSAAVTKLQMKYVCVGQPKTGTKTMAKIFDLLNFKVNGNPLCLNYDDDFILLDNNLSYFFERDNISKCHNNIEEFDAFHDYPYSFNYKYINDRFPYSKFILTIRDKEVWFNSLLSYQKLPNASNKFLLKKLYGHEVLSHENKKDIILKYNEYNVNIIKFFKDKPGKLLIVDLTKNRGNIKIKLGTFLKQNIDFEIPHENKQTYPKC